MVLLAFAAAAVAACQTEMGEPTASPAGNPPVATVEATREPLPTPVPPPPPTATPVPRAKVVSSLPRSGQSRAQTESMVNAARMALDEAGGRARGVLVDLVDLDSGSPQGGWDAEREGANARQAAADPAAVAFLGPFGSDGARVAIPILNRAGLFTISASASHPGLTHKVIGGDPSEPDIYYPSGARTFARVIPPDDAQGALAARWARQQGLKRAFVLDDGTLYGRSLTTAFARTAEVIGLEVVGGPERADTRAIAYDGLVRRVLASGAEVVFFAPREEAGSAKLVAELRSGAPKVRMVLSESLYSRAFAAQLGATGEGVYVMSGAVLPARLDGAGEAWYQRYRAKYGAEPSPFAAYTYEATQVVLRALEQVGAPDRARVADAIRAMGPMEGVLGRWSFDKNGNVDQPRLNLVPIRTGALNERGALLIGVGD